MANDKAGEQDELSIEHIKNAHPFGNGDGGMIVEKLAEFFVGLLSLIFNQLFNAKLLRNLVDSIYSG